jgi:hypothetical protein
VRATRGSIGRRSDRVAAGVGALAAVALFVAVLWSATDAPGAPQLALTAAGGNARVVNSKEGEAILGARNWQPGERVKGRVAIKNAGRDAAVFRLAAKQVRDARGAFGGRLGRATRIRVVRMRPAIHGRQVVYDGRLTKLRRVRVGNWPAGGTRYFRLRATMVLQEDESVDRYEGARLSFTFAWAATPSAP